MSTGNRDSLMPALRGSGDSLKFCCNGSRFPSPPCELACILFLYMSQVRSIHVYHHHDYVDFFLLNVGSKLYCFDSAAEVRSQKNLNQRRQIIDTTLLKCYLQVGGRKKKHIRNPQILHAHCFSMHDTCFCLKFVSKFIFLHAKEYIV